MSQSKCYTCVLFVCLFVPRYVISYEDHGYSIHLSPLTLVGLCAYLAFPCIFSICWITPTIQACTCNVLNHYTWSLTGDIAWPTVTTLRGLGQPLYHFGLYSYRQESKSATSPLASVVWCPILIASDFCQGVFLGVVQMCHMQWSAVFLLTKPQCS